MSAWTVDFKVGLSGNTLDASHYDPLARALEGMKEENPLDGKMSAAQFRFEANPAPGCCLI